MAFGENREGGGGFSVSFSTVANGVAVLALVAMCSVMWSDHSDLIKMQGKIEDLGNDIKRAEATANAALSSTYSLTGDELGLTGENNARKRDEESLGDRIKDIDSRERDIERTFGPLRVEHSGNGHGG